ncbi:putative ser thr protein phosphatase family [Erysiphe necator]|uniref:Putative ser thr protein phosphatase family n=1 Tax=Uncinula necator TaxID=52586 RepID=A0A0B1P4K5_UNCNE|nr:putative ser thr protein phosphatase family [Erysiphe necator]
MALKEYELQTIYQAIRSQNKDTPIQVFGSHTHIRNFVKYDSKAAGLQSGRYLETIGWASINGVKNNSQFGAADEVSFHRRYIDNNILGYRYHTGLSASEFPTEHGKNTTSFIAKARESLNLDHKYGCVPRDLYYTYSSYPKNDSITTWTLDELLPGIVKTKLQRAKTPTFLMLKSVVMRSDLLKGPFTRDSAFIFVPYEQNLAFIRNVPYKAAMEISKRGSWDLKIFDEKPLNRTTNKNNQLQSRELGTDSVHRNSQLFEKQKSLIASKPLTLVRGYTTNDDGGSDGDDTLHSPLGRFAFPPPILSSVVGLPSKGEPEYVDLFFNKPLTSMMLILLNNMGLKFDTSNVKDHSDELIRDIISQWVKENWAGEC